ncbi:MAG: hypothetical protein HW388_405 [Dehalococcoidia bacterium]|nr:hypothetical protein [Dehalococcoidia bacterium]
MATVNRGTLAIVMQLVGVGWYLATCIIMGLLGGLWLDRKLDTVPVFSLMGTALGTALAFYGTYKLVLPLLNNQGPSKKNGEK